MADGEVELRRASQLNAMQGAVVRTLRDVKTFGHGSKVTIVADQNLAAIYATFDNF